jgi:hypothetical protein
MERPARSMAKRAVQANSPHRNARSDPSLANGGRPAGGRPSAFSDDCCANGLSTECDAEGVLRSDGGIGFKLVGWDDGAMLFEYCSASSGTGVAFAE